MHGLPPVVRLARAQRAWPGRRGPRDEKSCLSIELPRDPSSVGASLRALRAPRCPAWGRSPYMAALRPSEMDTIAPIWTPFTPYRWLSVHMVHASAPRLAPALRRGADDRGRPVDHRGGPYHVAAHAELLRLEAECQADELGEVQDRHVEVAADDFLGQRLLQVEVQVAERAGGHEAVRLGVHRVAEVAAGLLERGLLVHRDDREAAALAHARIVDHGAAECLDQEVQVVVAGMLCVDAQPVARAHDVAAVEGADAQVGERPRHARAQLVEPDLLDEQPQEVLVGQALLVAEALGRERAVDVLAIG